MGTCMSDSLPTDYRTMTDEERARQQVALDRRRRDADAYIATLDSDMKQLEAMARCMRSFEFWCDRFCYTFDPRKAPTARRFVLYDFQREAARQLIHAIRNGGIVHLDKSRDMGASWIVMAVFTWMWLFEESFHAHVGSRVEALVDNYMTDSLFGKIDYILERLPSWMTPEFTPRVHRKSLQVLNPRPCKNLISGESSNPHFGRGPRKNVVYLDEFAMWENDTSVWTSIADTAPCRIVTSTPHGENNAFARLRHQPHIQRITLHWTLHPEKNDEWYARECALRDKLAVAQELDIDYAASAGNLALPQLSDETLRSRIVVPPVSVTDPANEKAGFFMGMDYGSTNPTSINVYRVLTLAPKVYKITSVWEFYKPSTLYEIADVIKACPWKPLVECIYADPSMWFYNQQDAHGQRGMTSLAFILRDVYGLYVAPGRRGDTYCLEQLREMWKDPDNIRFEICENCENQIRELEGLRYVTISDKMSHRYNQPEKLVDKDNHSWDNLKYFFNSYFEKPEAPEVPPEKPVLGHDALRREFTEIRNKKLAALTRTRPLQRRVFRYR